MRRILSKKSRLMIRRESELSVNREPELMVKHFFKVLTKEEQKEFNELLSRPGMESLVEEMNDRKVLAQHLRDREKINWEKSWEDIIKGYGKW